MHKSNPFCQTFLETGSEEIRLTFEFFTLQDAYPIFTKLFSNSTFLVVVNLILTAIEERILDNLQIIKMF